MIISRQIARSTTPLGSSCFKCLSTQAAPKEIDDIKAKNNADSEWNSALPYDSIPGPGKFELLASFMPGGRFHNKSRYDICKYLNKTYGDMVRMPGLFKQRDVTFVFNPTHFEKIYRNDGIWPSRRGLETLTHYRHVMRPEIFNDTGTLLTSDGEEWGKFRSIVNPVMMQPKTVRIYVSRMDRTTAKFIDRMREIRDPKTNELPLDFQAEINAWALEQICLVGLDTELGLIGKREKDHDGQRLIDAVNTIFSVVPDLEFKPSIWKYYETPKLKKLFKAYDALTDISLKYIDVAVERFNSKSNSDRSDNEKSVVERLIKINKSVAVIMALEMFFAGVDTTTSAMTACLLSLSKNPEKQEKLRQEIRKHLPERDSPVTEEILKHMTYLRAVIKEALRVYPIVHEQLRSSNVEFVLDNYRIPKKTDLLMIGTHSYEKSENFSEPEKFIPERWIRNKGDTSADAKCPATATKAANPFIYLPFGFGTRMCVGKRLVDMEMEILLTRLIRNFHVEYDYNEKEVMKLELIYTPVKPLNFKVTDIPN